MNQDFLDLFRALLEADAEFLVVGAFAVAVHAEPRATGDLDVWVNPTTENARRVFSALKKFGAPLADLSEQDLATPGVVFQMGLPPNRIDILTQISGVQFQDAWPGHGDCEIDDVRVPVIGRKDLIANKRAAGRPKDLFDLELLKKHSRK